MRINSNIPSLNAQRYLRQTSQAISRALERLSSGKRINSAKDDAAGLGIAERLESDVRGLAEAARGMNLSLSGLQSASGVISSQIELVQRMRELAVQSANGTLTATDRAHLNQEFETLYAEYNRLVSTHSFNGMNWLDGSIDELSLQAGAQKGNQIDLSLSSVDDDDVFTRLVGTGVYTRTQTLTNKIFTNEVFLRDFNNDGVSDLFSSDGGNTFSYWYGNGDGTFSSLATALRGGSAGGRGLVDFGDINGDGFEDIVSADFNGNVYVTENQNGVGFSISTVAFNSLFNVGVELFDIDNDGDLDLGLLGWGDLKIYLNDGEGVFVQHQQIVDADYGVTNFLNMTGGYQNTTTGDFNGDGFEDFVAYNSTAGSTFGIYFGQADGTLGSTPTEIARTGNSFSAADIDGDGIDEIVEAATVSTLRVHKWNGTGFTSTTNANWTMSSTHDLADVNGDGYVDIVGANYSSTSNLMYLLGNSSGTFSLGTTQPQAAALGAVALGDMNEDGVADLLTTISGPSGNVYLQGAVAQSATDELDISSLSSAQNVLKVLDNAMNHLLSAQANYGAMMNQLDYATTLASRQREDLSNARSQLEDADYAEEAGELIRLQILQTAQVAVTAQANLNLQNVLMLLRY